MLDGVVISKHYTSAFGSPCGLSGCPIRICVALASRVGSGAKRGVHMHVQHPKPDQENMCPTVRDILGLNDMEVDVADQGRTSGEIRAADDSMDVSMSGEDLSEPFQ